MTASPAVSLYPDDQHGTTQATTDRPVPYGELVRSIAADVLEPRGSNQVRGWSAGRPETLGPPVVRLATTPPENRGDLSGIFPQQVAATRAAQQGFAVLQEWEGYVVEVAKDFFTARLVDLTAGGHVEEEEGNFPLAELSDADRRQVRPGAVFRWTIAYRRAPGGTKQRVSLMVFRRLPAWTRRELERSRREAGEWASALGGE